MFDVRRHHDPQRRVLQVRQLREHIRLRLIDPGRHTRATPRRRQRNQMVPLRCRLSFTWPPTIGCFLRQEEHPMKRVVSMVSVTRVVSAATVLTDANATETVKMGMNEVPRVVALYGIIVHGNEMYGTAAVYLRSKNIVPPSTENAGRGRRGGGHH